MIAFADFTFRSKALIIAGLSVVLAVSGLFYMSQPVAKSASLARTVIIPQGASTADIANTLHQQGIIRNPLMFRILTRMQKLDNKLQAGEYEVAPHMSMSEVLRKITSGETVSYVFTIPEGFTVEQIANLLAEKGLGDREQFLAQARKGNPAYGFLPATSASGYVVEGFLFPDTYRIPKGMKEEAILAMMLQKFDTTVTPQMRETASQQGLSLFQMVTLASLVEREAKAAADRPIIAAVFLQRLKFEMPLQSCATIQYILGTPKTELSIQDTQIESPYNTYMNPGLPPGPIANPGVASISAVLNPAKTDALYFVAKPDGTHIFSRSYDEHLTAIEQVNKL